MQTPIKLTFFFFQAEDGIRDRNVTGVQTCALPIFAKGKALVTGGGSGQTLPCAICHGQSLKGLGEVPGIAGRPPIYTVRQLNDMQKGNRTGSLVELMKAVVAQLSVDDMVAIAAYLGSLEP